MERSYLRPEPTSNNQKVDLFNCLTGSQEKDKLVNHIHSLFRAQMLGPAFPCSLGKGAFAQLNYRFGVYTHMLDVQCAESLCEDIWDFGKEQPNIGQKESDFSTFVAVFKDATTAGEIQFEDMMWKLLQNIHNYDKKSFLWDSRTSDDPDDPRFSFSIGQKSFFLVGMSATSSRFSRRFTYPAIAFNSHHQFEHLRATNTFTKVQNIIRKLDIAIQGNINPSLQNYGLDSEAKQYSGRLVEQNWKCPFNTKP